MKYKGNVINNGGRSRVFCLHRIGEPKIQTDALNEKKD